MFEKIIPVFIAIIALQIFIKFVNRQKNNRRVSSRDFDYKQRINEFMKMGASYKDPDNVKMNKDEIRLKSLESDLMMDIPGNMSETRRDLHLIIEGVSHAVKGKTGSNTGDDAGYDSPEQMFDELVEVINRHRIKE